LLHFLKASPPTGGLYLALLGLFLYPPLPLRGILKGQTLSLPIPCSDGFALLYYISFPFLQEARELKEVVVEQALERRLLEKA